MSALWRWTQRLIVRQQSRSARRGKGGACTTSHQSNTRHGCITHTHTSTHICAHISTHTSTHIYYYDGYEGGEDGTWKVQDHNAQNEVLKLFTVHHTSVFIQSGLRYEELGRVAISFHYAVDCLWRKVATCGPQVRVSDAAVNSVNRRDTPFNLEPHCQNELDDYCEVGNVLEELEE